MIRQSAPVFFTRDIPATLAYYSSKLGFACLGTWQDPPVYAIVARDQQVIHFRCAEPPTANPDKYADESLDAHCPLKMPTHFMPSTPLKAWNSLGNLATRHGASGGSW